MRKPSRREFLRTVGTAAAGVAAAPGRADAPGRNAYAREVQAEASLLGWWRFDGDLQDTKGRAPGAMRGGDSVFVAGPLGARALSVDGGRFATMGASSHLDTEEATVELFFQLTAAPLGGYNPCLIAKRESSPNTRFSVHVWGDLSRMAVWNGQAVTEFTLPGGPVRIGHWYHLAVASRPDRLRVFVDGVECALQGGAPFNRAQKGLPLQAGASSPQGEEACACALAEVAIYGAALSSEAIARHADAAGWKARRMEAAQARKRQDAEMRKQAAERERRRRANTTQRLRDPRLFAAGAPRIYRGDHLDAIQFTLGGNGAGCLQMNGKAEWAIWQVFNNFPALAIPNSFIAVRAQAGDGAPVVRALQTAKAGPFPAVQSLSFRGEYPLAWYDFEDAALPVKVRMEAFSPFIPMKEQESSIPCAVFVLTAENPGDREAEVSFLAAQQNAVGASPDSPILDRRQSGYGDNRNAVVREGGATVLVMTKDNGQAASSGSMALFTTAGEAVGVAAAPSQKALLDGFTAGQVPHSGAMEEAGPSPAGETLNGALVVPFRLKPGEARSVPFVLCWHFPGARHGGDIAGWEHAGNKYATWWTDARDVARYVAANLDALAAGTRLYHDTFYRSNLPWWLKDRITSQTAILRSKTCFWAADDYFGAWEGCAPGGGCCAGSCTHVWHYAQAHARLFPGIARRMRAATYGYQHPDGSLPHRHPNVPPATDGQLGDILGAYREHLCGADGAWLAALWPRVKRAMEQTIQRWDPEEDGALAGAQWNTLDGELGGSTSWIGTLYLAALAASARMAEIHGDTVFAERCLRIRAAGAKRQNETLWNGEYYIQVRDPEPRNDYGEGCAIDQVLGEWWAGQVGLPTAYPQDRVRSAMKALICHNFRPDFHGVPQSPRKFVADDDPGLQMIQWPKGERPTPTILYGDEVMTGFEYAAAAAMVQFGLLREGFMVALAISDRYDGRLRTGLTPGGTSSWGYSGNPFGDDECGKYYARAMSVWSLLTTCQGFHYDGPAGRIGFRPVWKPEDHATFFTAAEGWGLFTQKRSGGRQRARVELTQGRLRLRELVFALPSSWKDVTTQVSAAGRPLMASHALDDITLNVHLPEEVVLEAGQSVVVEIMKV